MISPMYLGVLVFLVVYSKADAVQMKGMAPRRCYQCHSSWCDRLGTEPGALLAATCPPEKPHCATVAAAPYFSSSLTCAAAVDRPCSLTYDPQNSYELLCTCEEDLCNNLFTKTLQNQLITFVKNTVISNPRDYTDEFFNKTGMLSNDTFIYEKFTVDAKSGEEIIVEDNTDSPQSTSAENPKADALKFETTVPTDDEDDSEGSGLYEELQSHRRPADSPEAAPSAHQPADESAAPPFEMTFPITALVIHLVI